MSDQDSHEADARVSVEQKLLDAIREHVPGADPAASDKQKVREIIQALVTRAEAGHVEAGTMMAGLATLVLADSRVEVSTELRQWLCQVLCRLQATPRLAAKAFAPRAAGRPPLYSDDLKARLRFEEIKLMACAFARAAKSFGYKADAAFDRAAEMLRTVNVIDETGEVTKADFVDPKSGKPYTGAAVKGWFYTSGQTFDS